MRIYDNKERKIISKIEEITGIRLKIDSELIADKVTENIRKSAESCKDSNELVFKDDKGKELARIQNLKDFEDVLLSLNGNVILRKAKNNDYSRWLRNLREIELADKFKSIEKKFDDTEELRKTLIDILEEHRYSLNQSHVTNFQRYDGEPHTKINRIGEGSLGGKARGLTFLAELISKYISDDMFPGLRITVPRSIVLSTDVFDTFIYSNGLSVQNLFLLSDERITSTFIDASLPATIIGDLRSFVKNTRKPLVVRSSGALEDSLLQPFAGIYASILLPNESWETDLRFQEICNAIKYVYSSTYFEKARTYIKSTPKNIGDEKMAVLIQEVIGNKHEDYFYPTISGVAKSYNYYPSGPCKPEEGIVYLALGLGKAIVDGGSSYCFCPERPNVPMFGTPKDFMKYSQTSFYSLNLKSVYRIVKKNEETSLDKLDVDIAKKHGVLDKIASTYSTRDDSLYPGISDDGYLVINFSPIIDYNSIPLAKALNLLLNIGEIALDYPVEIEFAVNLSENESKESELIILQIRSMRPPGKYHDVEIGTYNPDKDICYSENALGNGIIDNIKDIIYVTSESFDMSNSTRAVNQIRKLNSKLMEEGKPYILVGPGRWGSTDPWLGIPVVWSDIAGAKVIVETPVKQRPIEPSQGSHFFHDMVSSQVGYIITRGGKGNIDWDFLASLPAVEDMEDVRHVSAPFQLEVRLDGKNGKANIRKTSNK